MTLAIAASLPGWPSRRPAGTVASGRWSTGAGSVGARSAVTLTSFHHRLVLGLLRLAQSGDLTEQGVSSSVNSLLLSSFGVRSREQPGCAPRVLPALMDLLCCEASMSACYEGEQGKPHIAELRALAAPIISGVRVRCRACGGSARGAGARVIRLVAIGDSIDRVAVC